jgi:hypothetical protein
MKFQIFVQTLKTKGNNIFKNVERRWMFMLKPLKKIMVKYWHFLMLMQVDYTTPYMPNVNSFTNVLQLWI